VLELESCYVVDIFGTDKDADVAVEAEYERDGIDLLTDKDISLLTRGKLCRGEVESSIL